MRESRRQFDPESTINPENSAQPLLKRLVESSIIHTNDWKSLTEQHIQEMKHLTSVEALLSSLQKHDLITEYQARRIEDGDLFGLVLGGYRILDLIGRGGMGTVFKAEHLRIRRHAAIKMVPMSASENSLESLRFSAEIRDIANLHHPNIVSIFDAGEIGGADMLTVGYQYYAMEYVDGLSLQQRAKAEPLAPEDACEIIYQIAGVLAEAHEHDLVHRDIKPANIMITPKGIAKLLDFGIAHHARQRITLPGVPMGSLSYMAPEQARDASRVDARADIFGLGATLYFAITGKEPFSCVGNVAHALMVRIKNKEVPRLRSERPDVSHELDEVVARMMAWQPEHRYQSAESVRRALLPFLTTSMLPQLELRMNRHGTRVSKLASLSSRVLIVDDEPEVAKLCKSILDCANLECRIAKNALEAISMLAEEPYDLALLDVEMPGMSGEELCRHLRENPPSAHLKIMMLSGGVSGDRLADMMSFGADDFMTKPFTAVQFLARVRGLLRLKSAQDRTEELNTQMRSSARALEQALGARDIDLVRARNSLVLAMARLAEQRDNETGVHLLRLQHYCRCLAEEAMRTGIYADVIDNDFTEMLCSCAPLHDIGKVGIPDHILHKPGPLDPVERRIMETHTVLGSDMLRQVAEEHEFAVGFLNLAADVARHHHERFDGTGYPDRLMGNDIPLAARILAIADVYDALRTRRVYKPAFTHEETLEIIHRDFAQQFDPALLAVFVTCADQFRSIYQELTNA